MRLNQAGAGSALVSCSTDIVLAVSWAIPSALLPTTSVIITLFTPEMLGLFDAVPLLWHSACRGQ